MKKILFLLGFALIAACAANAQSYYGVLVDTVFTNAHAATFMKTITGAKANISFGYVITKTSGTVAGTIVVSGTLDGTNYFTVDSYTLTDASVNHALTLTNNAYGKYKVVVTTTGTQVSRYKIELLYH